MAIQPIRLFGDPVLRRPSIEVVDFDRELRTLVQDLTDTMLDAPGAGLAAPQIGVGLRVFTWYVEGETGHLINPTIQLSEETQDGEEGCLSIPDLYIECRRAAHAVAHGWNMYGEPVTINGSKMLARAIQHETDHLDGVMFLDRLDTAARKTAMKIIRESEWFGAETPMVKVSPHPTLGRGSLVRVAFAGTPDVAVPALDAIIGSSHQVAVVITRPDAPAGRGRTLLPSPVAVRAAELQIPVLKPTHPRDLDFQSELAEFGVDCCAVVAYGALLPQSALDLIPHGWVNLHFSCLPAWRGAAPVQHAIRAGDEVTGATTFRIVRELDAGPIFGIMTERIRPNDTAGDLLGRLAEGGSGLLVATLDGIEDGSLEARPQPSDGVSFAPKITVDDARVDWRIAARAVDHLIRSCTPAPGAWTTYEGERLKLGPILYAAEHPTLAPGALAVTKNAVHVGTGTSPVRLGDVQAVGKRPMPAADWARGLRLAAGSRLGN